MEIHVNIFIFLILFIHLTYEQSPNSFEMREHSLSRPYPSVFSTSNSHWHLTGNTIATDRYIRLTYDAQSRAGGLWNMIPISYSDWEVQVHFKIHGSGKQLFGDGLVIWYVRDPQATGPVFGYKDHFHGLAVILDTYANRQGIYTSLPYVSVVINNGSLHYDHDFDGANITLGGCSSAFRDRDADTLVAIRYQNDRLTILTDVDGENTWSECVSMDDVHLPTFYYLGFSAATGELTDNHDIISVRTYQLESTEQRREENRRDLIPSGPSNKMGNTPQDSSTSTVWKVFKIFFIIILLLIVALAGAGGYYYMKKNRYRRSRLY